VPCATRNVTTRVPFVVVRTLVCRRPRTRNLGASRPLGREGGRRHIDRIIGMAWREPRPHPRQGHHRRGTGALLARRPSGGATPTKRNKKETPGADHRPLASSCHPPGGRCADAAHSPAVSCPSRLFVGDVIALCVYVLRSPGIPQPVRARPSRLGSITSACPGGRGHVVVVALLLATRACLVGNRSGRGRRDWIVGGAAPARASGRRFKAPSRNQKRIDR
jgi:hypothetical protein